VKNGGPEYRGPIFMRWTVLSTRRPRIFYALSLHRFDIADPYDLPFSHNTANVKKNATSRFDLVSAKIPNVWVLSQSPRNASRVSSRFRIYRAYPCWTPQIEGCWCFFSIFGCGAHFKRELRQNGWRQTKTICEQELLRLSRVARAMLKLLVELKLSL